MFTPSIWLLCMFIPYVGQGYYVAPYVRNKIRTGLNNYWRILLPTRISNWAWSIQNQQTGRSLDHHVAILVLLPMQRKLLPFGFCRGLKATTIHFGRRMSKEKLGNILKFSFSHLNVNGMGLYFNNIRQFTFKAFTYILCHLRENSQLTGTGNFFSNSGWKGNFWITLRLHAKYWLHFCCGSYYAIWRIYQGERKTSKSCFLS